MTRKFGDQIYNLARIGQLGAFEIGRAVTSESNIAAHDYAGLYPSRGEHDVEPHGNRGIEHEAPELEYDEPELDR